MLLKDISSFINRELDSDGEENQNNYNNLNFLEKN